jgi:chromosome segregation ATPase
MTGMAAQLRHKEEDLMELQEKHEMLRKDYDEVVANEAQAQRDKAAAEAALTAMETRARRVPRVRPGDSTIASAVKRPRTMEVEVNKPVEMQELGDVEPDIGDKSERVRENVNPETLTQG